MKKGDRYTQKYYKKDYVIIQKISSKKVWFQDNALKKTFVISREKFESSFEEME